MANWNRRGVSPIAWLLAVLLPTLAVGQAVITLVMPVGSRQLGMGETAIAVADDVFATFWNPAGLAFGPLADEWELALASELDNRHKMDFTSLGAREKKGILTRTTLWSGTLNEIVHFDGKVWKEYHEHVLGQDETIEQAVRKFAGTEENLDSMVVRVREFNQLESPEDEKDLITLKLPYNLLFPGQTATALIVDRAQRLWVGTPVGLFRFDGEKWRSFAHEEAFGGEGYAEKHHVTSLALREVEVWIGTKGGLFRYRKNRFVPRGETILPSQHVTAIATHPNSKEVFVALRNQGVARYTPSRGEGLPAKWKLFSVTDGLLDSAVHSLVLDKYGHLWVGHPHGISHFSLIDWQRITFQNQSVRSLDLADDGSIWIGTDKGVWKHTPAYSNPKGRRSKDDATRVAKKGDWFHYHTGNALVDNQDLVIETQGDDVWFVTKAGVERYNAAKSQVGLFYESLLPILNIEDLFHVFAAATFPLQEWGTVGGFVNFISFGEIPLTSETEEEIRTFSSTETVGALTYGTKLNKYTGLGINVKFIYSALAPGLSAQGEESDGIAASYAADLGLLWKDVFFRGFRAGFVMQNIGPAVFYVDQDQSDPIPFTWKVGLGYEVLSTPNHRLLLAADANREAVYYEVGRRGATPVYVGAWKSLIYPFGDADKDHGNIEVIEENIRKTVFNGGAEYTYANVVSFRSGVLWDESGERKELDLGLGFALSDVLQIDATYIRDFGGGIRDGQKRFSLIFKF